MRHHVEGRRLDYQTECDDILSENYQALLDLVDTVEQTDISKKEGFSFTAYAATRMRQRANEYIANMAEIVRPEASSREGILLHSLSKFGTSIGKPPAQWGEEEIRAAQQHFKCSIGIMRSLVGHYQREFAPLEEQLGDEQGARERHETITGDTTNTPDSLLGYRGMSPEDILIHREEREERELDPTPEFDMDWARSKLDEWLNLLPKDEKYVIMYRYLVPSRTLDTLGEATRGELSESATAAQVRNIIKVNVRVEDVSAIDASARARLTRFVEGDFSEVDPALAEEHRLRTNLEKIKNKAGEQWDTWVLMLPRRCQTILYMRWSGQDDAKKSYPMPFESVVAERGSRERGLKGTIEEAKELEKQAFAILNHFAEGDFSEAQYTSVADTIPKDIVQAFYDTLPESVGKYAIHGRLLSPTVSSTELNKDGTPKVFKRSFVTVGRVWKQRLEKQLGKPLAPEEAAEVAERAYEQLCKELIEYVAKVQPIVEEE